MNEIIVTLIEIIIFSVLMVIMSEFMCRKATRNLRAEIKAIEKLCLENNLDLVLLKEELILKHGNDSIGSPKLDPVDCFNNTKTKDTSVTGTSVKEK